ncbi:MAG: S-layer homology domain-containing protein [Candidatus Margulisiibacteriota bacterium]
MAPDITRLGVGARPLGMGKMFAAISDDVSSMYLNPAGLYQLKNPEFLSMSGKFANTVNYLTFAGALPSKFGTVGVGYASAGLGFSIPALTLVEIAPGEFRVIPSTTESVSSGYNNYVVSLAYGNVFLRPDIYAGASLKFFNESFSGAAAGSGSGIDLDLGAMYKPNSFLTLGLSGKNILPKDLGGKLRWTSGLEESIPATINIGGNLKFRSLGKANVGELNLGADYEFSPKQSNIPGLWHIGAEWWPILNIGLRAGIDQDALGTGSGLNLEAIGNSTAGISLIIQDFRFDYAYHTYNNIPANATNYFSLCYLAPKPKIKTPLVINYPKDRSISYSEKTALRGSVNDPAVKYIRLKGTDLTFDKKGSFETISNLDYGRNYLTVEGFNAGKKKTASAAARVLRLKSFLDVSDGYWAKEPIEYLATIGIIEGYPNGTFSPEAAVSRTELTILLQKLTTVEAKSINWPLFTDLPANHWAAKYIYAAARQKLVFGYPDNTFGPSKEVTRAEGVTMFARFANLPELKVLESPFKDVSGRHWAVAMITSAKENSLLNYLSNSKFWPNNMLTRAEVANILALTDFGKKKIEELKW